MSGRPDNPPGLKDKDLLGVPWRIALALQADGWYLRSDIVWHKPNAMPESVKDRPTRAHEYVFMFTREENYTYYADAVMEEAEDGGTRNRRSVWSINTSPANGSHIASFPEDLVEPCVLASRRKVIITFSADPDISIFEEISANKLKNVVAIEIKGGTDKSNIWNRFGEAEKNHQSAKQRGFVEFWTIYNVPSLNLAKAREKSPTTNRFYSLIDLSLPTTEEFADFRDRLVSLVGIAAQSS